MNAMNMDTHENLVKEYNCLCMKVDSAGTAPAVGCVLKGKAQDGASIQLLSHYDVSTRHKKENFWALRSATFRCIFGTDCKYTFNKQTGERIPNDPVEVDSSSHAAADTVLDQQICICPPDYDTSKCFVDVPELNLGIERKGMIENRPGDDLNVRRLNLVKFESWFSMRTHIPGMMHNTETCHHLGKMMYAALIDQADYILGDGNKFNRRNFKNDTQSDYTTCIIIDMLCRILKNINALRSYEDRVAYQVVSSSSHYEWLAGNTGKQADTDCLICSSLHYGKQAVMRRARCEERGFHMRRPYEGFPLKAGVILGEKERPKYMKRIEIGLRSTDKES